MRRLATLPPLTLLVGCASLGSYHEARTTPKGTGSTRLGATHAPMKSPLSGDLGATSPWVYSIGGRYGLFDRLDFGMDFTLSSTYSMDVKYQLLGLDSHSLVQVSTGLKAAYGSILFKNTDAALNGTTIIDAILPLYATVSPTRWTSLTVSPQFCYRTSLTEEVYPSQGIVGANVSVKLGHRLAVVGEYGYHHQMTTGQPLVNYGAMLLLPLDALGDLDL